MFCVVLLGGLGLLCCDLDFLSFDLGGLFLCVCCCSLVAVSLLVVGLDVDFGFGDSVRPCLDCFVELVCLELFCFGCLVFPV